MKKSLFELRIFSTSAMPFDNFVLIIKQKRSMVTRNYPFIHVFIFVPAAIVFFARIDINELVLNVGNYL
jgi:hypothetical protein